MRKVLKIFLALILSVCLVACSSNSSSDSSSSSDATSTDSGTSDETTKVANYEYTKTASEITDTFLAKAQAVVEESLSDGLNFNKSSTNTENYINVESLSYQGYFFLYLNDFDEYSTYYGRSYNKLLLVYGATVKSTDGSFDDMDVYFAVGPNDIKTNQSTGENSAVLEAGNLNESDCLTFFGDSLFLGEEYNVQASDSISEAIEDISDFYGEYYTIETVDLD
ncbi:MAG: hypothetical protein LUH02_03480 [Erysipelotrichaceae bacterium]|nr:hypothetical protein [Erysipelotrichaceae bacterium]